MTVSDYAASARQTMLIDCARRTQIITWLIAVVRHQACRHLLTSCTKGGCSLTVRPYPLAAHLTAIICWSASWTAAFRLVAIRHSQLVSFLSHNFLSVFMLLVFMMQIWFTYGAAAQISLLPSQVRRSSGHMHTDSSAHACPYLNTTMQRIVSTCNTYKQRQACPMSFIHLCS